MAASINTSLCCEFLRQECFLLRLVPCRHLGWIVADMHACCSGFKGARNDLAGYLHITVRRWVAARRRSLSLWMRILIRILARRIVRAFMVYMYGP